MVPQGRRCQVSPAITDEKSIETLRKSAEQLRLFVEQAPVGIAMFDRDMRYLATSERWRSSYGLGEESLVGRSHYEVFPDLPRSWKEAHQRALAGETLREEQDPFPRADGCLQWRRWEMRPWRRTNGTIGGILIFSEDVTARVEMERALRESREDLDRAQAVARTGSWRLDVNRNKLAWSAETFRIFGISPETPLTYESFLAAVHPDDREYVDRSWKAALAGARYDIEHRIVVGKKIKWVRERAELEFDAAGKLLGGFGTVQDITDKKQKEWQLRESEERLRLSNEAGGIGTFTIDLETNCAMYSPELSAMLGIPRVSRAPVEALFTQVHCDDQARIRAAFQAALQAPGKSGHRGEFRFVLPGGEVRWMVLNSRVEFRKGPLGRTPSLIFGACVDITELKRTEMALRESEARLRMAQQAAQVGTFVVNIETGASTWTPELEALHGLPSGAFAQTRQAWETLIHPEDRAEANRLVEESLATSQPTIGEWRVRWPDGSIHWLAGRWQVFKDSSGKPLSITGVNYDITDRKQAEARYRMLYESLRDAFVQVSMDGPIVEFNDLYCQMLGYSPEEIRTLTYQELTPARWHDFEERIVREQILPRGYSDIYEKEYRRKDGTIIPVELRTILSRDASGSNTMWAIVRDITERKRAERALRESREDLDRAQAVARIGSWRIDVTRNEVTWSAETFRIFRISPETPLTYESFLAAVHPDDRERVNNDWKTALGGALFEIEYRIMAAEETKWVRARAELERDDTGAVLGGFGTVQDITDRKRAEEQLRESEERFRGIFQHAGTGIAISALNGRFLSCNPAYSAMLGYTEDELRALVFPDLIHPDDRETNLAKVQRLLAQEVPSIEVTNRYIGKHGKLLWVHKYVSLLRDASGKPTSFIVLVTDITERKHNEEQIKLLMSEVNHRSKNLLTLVLAIARQTVATSADDFIDRFQERILALSASQNLLVRNKWKGAHLDKLAHSQLAHFNDLIGTRIKISGPPLLVSASAAQTLGMALHELATNAGKYGALSTEGGSVEVTWRVENREGLGGTFLISWRESGGPIVKAPTRSGFGSTVTGRMAEMSLNGTVDLAYASSGVVWRLQSPIGSVLEETGHGNLESEKLTDERLRQSQTLLV